MEPKSIAFFAAVAGSILAVISATTLPTIAHAITESEGGTETNAEQQDESNTAVATEEEDGAANTQSTEENTDSMSEDAAESDDTAGQSLSLEIGRAHV